MTGASWYDHQEKRCRELEGKAGGGFGSLSMQRRTKTDRRVKDIHTNAMNDRWTGRGEAKELLGYHPVSVVGKR